MPCTMGQSHCIACCLGFNFASDTGGADKRVSQATSGVTDVCGHLARIACSESEAGAGSKIRQEGASGASGEARAHVKVGRSKA